jgi:hypothetical protein
MKRLLIFALLVIASQTLIFAQTRAKSNLSASMGSLETALIAKEKQKWEALKNGRWLSLKDMFAEDFLSIGYEPAGTVKMTTKAQSFSQENWLPPGIEFTLSDFKVVSADKDSAVVTYIATGPIKVHATSVWAKRGKEWKTIFYQATMTR